MNESKAGYGARHAGHDLRQHRVGAGRWASSPTSIRGTASKRGEVQLRRRDLPRAAADKAARFIMDCSQNGLPLVFFQDVQGFMVGRDVEHAGIIRSGAKLVSAVSNAVVPKITLIVGGSFGAGHYAAVRKGVRPRALSTFAWAGARYAVMGGGQAAETLQTLRQQQATRLAGETLSPEARSRALRQKTRDEYQAQTDIRYGAARGWVDAIIAPHTTRDVLITALEVAVRRQPSGGFRSSACSRFSDERVRRPCLRQLRIGNAQGFWGDSRRRTRAAWPQQPDLDFLTLDYLAEVSMSILATRRERDRRRLCPTLSRSSSRSPPSGRGGARCGW